MTQVYYIPVTIFQVLVRHPDSLDYVPYGPEFNEFNDMYEWLGPRDMWCDHSFTARDYFSPWSNGKYADDLSDLGHHWYPVYHNDSSHRSIYILREVTSIYDKRTTKIEAMAYFGDAVCSPLAFLELTVDTNTELTVGGVL